MVAIIISIIALILFLHTKFCIRDAASRFFLYCYIAYWNISLFISCFQPYGMETNQPYTYFLLILGMISFYIGFATYGRVIPFKNRFSSNKLYGHVSMILSNKFINIIYILCILFSLSYARKALLAAALEEGAIMTGDRIDFIFDGSATSFLFYNYIIVPLFYITLSLLCVALVKPNKKFFFFYIFSIIFLISYIILAGGRSIFIIILMYLFLTYILMNIRNNRIRIPTKIILSGIILIAIAFVGMAFQTSYRTKGTYTIDKEDAIESISKMGESFLVYSIIPIRLFDVAINNNVPERLNYPYLGRASIAGTDELICGVLKRFTGEKYNSTIEIVKYTQDTWISLIPGKWPFNYCYTALFYNYMDFGILGLIFIPFLMGYCLRMFIRLFLITSTLPSFAIISFGYYMMLHSLFTCYFIKNWVILYCLILIVWQYVVQKNSKSSGILKHTFNESIIHT